MTAECAQIPSMNSRCIDNSFTFEPIQISSDSNIIRKYCESRQSLIEANNTITNLRKELSKAYEDLNSERKKSTKSSKALTIISCSLTALQEKYDDRLSQIVSQESDTAATAIKHEEPSSNSTPVTEIAQPPSESKTAPKSTAASRQTVDLSVHNDLKTQYTILQRKYIDVLDKKSKDQPVRKITAAKAKKQASMADSIVIHNYKVEIEQLETKAKSVKGAEKDMITQRIAICHFNKDTIRRVYGLREMTDKTTADIQRSQKEASEFAAEKEKTLSEIKANVEQAERLQNTSKISSDDLSKNLVTCLDSISQLQETCDTLKQHSLMQNKLKSISLALPQPSQMKVYLAVPKKLKTIKQQKENLAKINKQLDKDKLQQKLQELVNDIEILENNIILQRNTCAQAKKLNQALTESLKVVSCYAYQ
ncbi:hypothetical protein HMPREF1544_04767 [Mucor circinelloides 1006PhL]|uniref:Uncharacterized protein n=1 Tax=Mucor circinelloides f. circinelloides (strain 1006PhL) TaxID=1220926 RepID=S2JDT8_MUCC1|nr:hypothetical protein HMPREF1544_04767 [Mucor circinelloides 1006PhL]KAG1114904.1 hypothetical protein G6F42_014076 [Rhizopus arrhizus]